MLLRKHTSLKGGIHMCQNICNMLQVRTLPTVRDIKCWLCARISWKMLDGSMRSGGHYLHASSWRRPFQVTFLCMCAGVLAPLRQFLEAPGAMQQLPKQLKQQLAAAVVEAVNARYQALAEELLVTVRKTESSLKRLKKVRPGEAEAPDAMSDSDKITLQLYLDVQEHGRQIEGFGVQLQGMGSYSSLLAVVTLQPPQQQQQ